MSTKTNRIREQIAAGVADVVEEALGSAETKERRSAPSAQRRRRWLSAPPAGTVRTPTGMSMPTEVAEEEAMVEEVNEPWLAGFRQGYRQGRVTLTHDLSALLGTPEPTNGHEEEPAPAPTTAKAEPAPAATPRKTPTGEPYEFTTVRQAILDVPRIRGTWMTAAEVVEAAPDVVGRALNPNSVKTGLYNGVRDGVLRKRKRKGVEGGVEYRTKAKPGRKPRGKKK